MTLVIVQLTRQILIYTSDNTVIIAGPSTGCALTELEIREAVNEVLDDKK
jgi:hypothetical protein